MSSLFRLVRSDIKRAYPNAGFFKTLFGSIVNSSIHACLMVRLAQCSPFYGYWFFRRLLICLHGIDIGRGAEIGEGLSLPHPLGIVIGQGVKIGRNCSIFQGVTIGQSKGVYPAVGDEVTIYPNVVIVGGVKLADGRRIRACSYLDDSVVS